MPPPSDPRCSVCDAPLADPLQRHRGTCADLACLRSAAVAAGRAHLARERERDRRRGRAAAAAAGTPHGLGILDRAGPLGPRDPEEVAALEAAVGAAVAAAFADDAMAPDPLDEAPPPDPLTGAVCTACRGGCCVHGLRRHGFVDPPLIARQRARRPGLTPEAARAIYLDARPRLSSRGACLFQGADGCALPREDRSAICNGYVCEVVHRARDAVCAMADGPVAVARCGDGAPEVVARLPPRGG